MARSWSLRRGHASASFPTPGAASQRPAWLTVLLGLTTVAVVTLSSWFIYHHADDTEPANGHSVAESPSLITSALASMRPSVTPESAALRVGLEHQPLSDAALARTSPLLGQAEARLIGIYRLIQQSKPREALREAEALALDHPNFQLAQLVLGDLLNLQTRPVKQFGDVADTQALAAAKQLQELREQSRRRLVALTERPPEGAVPSQFLALSSSSRHAIAIDATRSRLYLFENTAARSSDAQGRVSAAQMKLIADYYISVGQAGIDKRSEGDLRTPLGIYYITSSLDPEKLPDLYGSGALPINYPNGLDALRGNTGSGIWLHGSPSEQFARAPQASEGCVVLSNPDLENLLALVSVRTTPVIIATELQWVRPEALNAEREGFQTTLAHWRTLKSAGDLAKLQQLYSPRFENQGQTLAEWWPRVEDEVKAKGDRAMQVKDLSVLRWLDQDDTLVVTFGEVAEGVRRGVTKRQYWMREDNQWKIIFEGAV
jgi:murein L,D-transpeptidase YafK